VSVRVAVDAAFDSEPAPDVPIAHEPQESRQATVVAR